MTDEHQVPEAITRYFIQVTGEKFKALDRQFEKLNDKLDKHADKTAVQLDELKKFKFTWTGGIVVLNAVITLLIALFLRS